MDTDTDSRIYSVVDGKELEKETLIAEDGDVLSSSFDFYDFEYFAGQGPSTSRFPLANPQTKREVVYERREIIYSSPSATTEQPRITKRVIETRTIKPISHRGVGSWVKENLYEKPTEWIHSVISRPMHYLMKPFHWLNENIGTPLLKPFKWFENLITKPFKWMETLLSKFLPSWLPLKWLLPLILLPLLAYFLLPLLPTIFSSPLFSWLPQRFLLPLTHYQGEQVTRHHKHPEVFVQDRDLELLQDLYYKSQLLEQEKKQKESTSEVHKGGKEEVEEARESPTHIPSGPTPLVHSDEAILSGFDRHVHKGVEHDPLTPSQLQRQKQIITLEVQPDPGDEWTPPPKPKADMEPEVIPNAIPEQAAPLHWRKQY